MGKISSYTYNTSPSTSDYLIGDSATGPTTYNYKLSDLITTFFNNVPNSSIKSTALALSHALDSVNGVQSATNTGTNGGTMYYINLGGIKLLWCISSTAYSVAAGADATGIRINYPAGFFSAVNVVIPSILNLTNNSQQNVFVQDGPNTTSNTINIHNFSGVSVGGNAAVFVIGN